MAFDILIRGGTVVDGTGAAGVWADVGVSGGRVAAVAVLEGAEAESEIDAAGLVVAPGLHRHALPLRPVVVRLSRR